MLGSYKRYWEPSLTEVVGLSVPVGAIATFFTQPLEFVKTRIQVRTEGIGLRQLRNELGVNPWRIFREIHETGGGLSHFYYGFDAALYSRLGYLFIRNFLYKAIYDQVKPVKPFNDLTLREKAVLSGSVGAFAAFVTSPFELAQVRMIADGGLPQPLRRNYKSAFDAINRIQVEEGGSRALFRGAFAHVVKLAALNVSLTGPYDYMKEKIWLVFGDFGFNHFLALTWASFWATLFTLPLDNVQTRVLKAFPDPSKNRLNYQNYLDVFKQIYFYERVHGFYAGALPYYGKMFITAWLTCTLVNGVMDSQKRAAGLEEWQI
ncbi:unnamed protein product [Paramecium primaurelia]|uniref:Mitochondrial carrier protein n=1 Tax=Paramecium primaurelia TaxID=5886 RepID=A0A8S1M8Z9_PARPR|nr:unnamed protein product [Paramecium primaurelia]